MRLHQHLRVSLPARGQAPLANQEVPGRRRQMPKRSTGPPDALGADRETCAVRSSPARSCPRREVAGPTSDPRGCHIRRAGGVLMLLNVELAKLGELLRWFHEAEGLAGSVVEAAGEAGEVLGRVNAEIGAFGHVLA